MISGTIKNAYGPIHLNIIENYFGTENVNITRPRNKSYPIEIPKSKESQTLKNRDYRFFEKIFDDKDKIILSSPKPHAQFKAEGKNLLLFERQKEFVSAIL